ncbi:MAG TPA: hypothetical protein VG101_01785 [Puia sp.]|jgi:hypothetical protein|nr:hypothetical protein [Puia sp.]
MNEFFSFRRFARLFVKHTAEHYRVYLMSVGVLAGVLILSGVFLFIVVPDAPDTGFQTASFVIVLFVAGGIFASTVFSDYGEKNKAIPALTLPATVFEKFLVGWLYSYPIFLVVYTAVYYLALLALAGMRHLSAGQQFAFFSIDQEDMLVLWVLFTEVHAIALFGAIFFRKLQFVKTGFSFFVSLMVVLLGNSLFLKIITGAKVEKLSIPFGHFNFYKGEGYYSIGIGHESSVFILWLMLAVAVLGWIATYYRLKEKQV